MARAGSGKWKSVALTWVFWVSVGYVSVFGGIWGGPDVDTVSANPTAVGPGGTSTISVTLLGAPDTADEYLFSVAPGEGTFPSGTNTELFTGAAAAVPPTAVWTAPAGTGPVTITVRATGPGSFGGRFWSEGTVVVNVDITNLPPMIDTLVASPAQVDPGQSSNLSCTAIDPDGDPVTYTWTAASGTLVPSGNTAVWTSPAAGGTHTVQVEAKDPSGASSIGTLTFTPPPAAAYVTDYTASLQGPVRLCFDAAGNLYASEGGNRVVVLDYLGRQVREITGLGRALGVAVLNGKLFVGESSRDAVSVRALDGTPLYFLGAGAGEFDVPTDICTNGVDRVYVLDSNRNQVRCFQEDGTPLFNFGLTGAALGEFDFPSGIAFNQTTQEVLVSDQRNHRVQIFDPAGAPQGSFGSDHPLFSRITGLAVDPQGRIYVSDVHQAVVSVFNSAGVYQFRLGTLGNGPGELRLPQDIAVGALGKVAISSPGSGRVVVYSVTGIDTDTDGMLDSWEITYGLDPFDASDAEGDRDGDGLSNHQEHALGTDPNSVDSDGDGVNDNVELAEGTDPTDPQSHRPRAVVGADQTVPPTFVTLDGSQSYDTFAMSLSYSWTLVSGPAPVTLPAAAAPGVLLTTAGDYVFQLVVDNGAFPSYPQVTRVTVENVAPDVVAGYPAAVAPGTAIALDGSATLDLNGDALTYAWTEDPQNPQPALIADPSLVQNTVAPGQEGLYAFFLTASDAVNAPVTSAPVYVVVDGLTHVPLADAGADFSAEVFAPVSLDGRLSRDLDGDPLTFTWTQVAGDVVSLQSAGTAQPTFVALQPGALTFELVVQDSRGPSVPDRVTVVVNDAQSPLPWVTARADPTGTTEQEIALTATAEAGQAGNPLTLAWTQVAGPRAHLLRADSLAAGFVAIEPGTYAFEFRAEELGAWSVPARVEVLVTGPTNSAPIASITAVPPTLLGTPVFLDATGSQDPDALDVLTYRWIQLQGPGAVLSDPTAALATFDPPAVGVYVFEVFVSDAECSSTAQLAVIVEAPTNHVPVALVRASGTPPASQLTLQTSVGKAVRLDASPSYDPDGSPLTTVWSQTAGPPTTLSDHQAPRPQFSPTQAGDYTFSVTVDDGEHRSPAAQVTVQVAPAVNTPPKKKDKGSLSVFGLTVFGAGCSLAPRGGATSSPDGFPGLLLLLALFGLVRARKEREVCAPFSAGSG